MADGQGDTIETRLVRIETKLDRALEDMQDHEDRLRCVEGRTSLPWELMRALGAGLAGFFGGYGGGRGF